MRPAAKALLSAACSAASVRAPLAAQKTQAFSGGGITGVLVRGEYPTVSAQRWAQRRPALGIPGDDGVLCPRRGYSDLRSQPRGRHQLTACQATRVTACSVSRGSSRSLPPTSRVSVCNSKSGGAAFGSLPCSVGGLRWATSSRPGCSTAARALAEETVAAPEALAAGEHAERDQAPVGAAASQVSECGEHTGETDDDEEAAKVDLIPWPPGGQRSAHMPCGPWKMSATQHTRTDMLFSGNMPPSRTSREHVGYSR